ncbi:hypothetical protein [Opitutus sp. ER46]|uniref:hypothetical protein n=1 Tax=Opitutus sp. ER46 TaxID=2161864 RepID=UPI000D30C5D6|nr:hypothetical protein [Opitutus sp. ER46]PTX92523.1 hypothetical protein DB354_14425 [Opitutus sp. ER46]
MGLDIRLPIGLMFSLVGVLLVIAGFTVSPEELKRSLDININLYWGLGLIAFGLVMLIPALRSRGKGQG